MSNDTTSSRWKDLPLDPVPTKKASPDPPRATSFCDLPDEIATNILSRLPVKTLVSSTSVSKKWCSLIRTRSFIDIHLARSLSELAVVDKTQDTGSVAKGCILVMPSVCSEKHILSIFYDDEKSCTHRSAVEIPFQTCSRRVAIVDSCNGLLCLTDKAYYTFGRDVYLYNPVVRKYKQLSNEFSCFVDWMEKGGAPHVVLGFGYHQIENDYKVVRILYSYGRQKLPPSAEVYSLREKKWWSVEIQIKSTASRHCTAFIDGCIYWLGVEETQKQTPVLIQFDLRNEVFHEVELPCYPPVNVMRWNDSVCVSIEGVLNGKLGFALWVLKKDDDGKIWWKKQVDFVSLVKLGGLPVGVTWTGKLVVEADVLDTTGLQAKTVVVNLKDFNSSVLAVDGPHTIHTNFQESLVLFSE